MLDEYKFKSAPFAHQRELLEISATREHYAFLMEQGTGKSKPTIDTAAWHFQCKRIQCLIIIAPNGVHRKWMREDIPLSLPDTIQFKAAVWQSSSTKAEKAIEALFEPGSYLRILCVNVESFSGDASKKSKRVPKGVAILRRLLSTFDCFVAIDESSYIKAPESSRTENIVDLGEMAKFRRIMSGTASPESPMNLFSQFKFLSADILGKSFYAFKAQYATILPASSPLVQGIMRKHNMRFAPQLIAEDPITGQPQYRNLDLLKALIAPHSYRKLKSECFDLPGKLYKTRYFEMEKEQARLYASLKARQKAEFMGGTTTIIQKITLLMRLSQLVRGYMLDQDGRLVRLFEPHKNPAIITMLDALEGRTSRTIIWCRFKHEIEDVLAVLGDRAVPYFGDTNNDDREANLKRFKDGEVQYFVGTVDAGGIGLNMAECSYAFFYSNQFSSGKRLQAEDRCHRYGSEGEIIDGENHVLYEDLVCPDTIDEYILATLKKKKEMSEYIMDFGVVYG